jgi:hypothetical protein
VDPILVYECTATFYRDIPWDTGGREPMPTTVRRKKILTVLFLADSKTEIERAAMSWAYRLRNNMNPKYSLYSVEVCPRYIGIIGMDGRSRSFHEGSVFKWP